MLAKPRTNYFHTITSKNRPKELRLKISTDFLFFWRKTTKMSRVGKQAEVSQIVSASLFEVTADVQAQRR